MAPPLPRRAAGPRDPRRSQPSYPALLFATAAALGAPLAAQDSPADSQDPAPIRVGLRARLGGADRLTSLRYIGGFETKTLLLETLVRRGQDGRIEPGLASQWAVEPGGKTFSFQIRPGAQFHDGTPVTDEAVCAHFRRWFGHEEHDWLRVNRRIESVEPLGEGRFAIHLDRPYALLEDLVAINPCAVVAPSSTDWEGEFVRPIGTGPFRFEAAFDNGRRWRLRALEDTGPRIDVTFYPRGRDTTPLDDLIRGTIDAFAGGWDEDLPAERLTEMEQDPRFAVTTAPGSSVVLLTFRFDEGATSDPAVRARIARAIDRGELIRIVEGGRADLCTTWAAPSVGFWPKGPATPRILARLGAGGRWTEAGTGSEEADADATPIALTVSGGRGGRAARAALEVVAQLRRAGFDASYLAPPAHLREASKTVVDATSAVRPLTSESGEIRARYRDEAHARQGRTDVRVEITHGMPYCPHQSLVARFGMKGTPPAAPKGAPLELVELVEEAAATALEADRLEVYARIQALMDEQHVVVPLYAPWRVAVHRTGIEGIRLDPDVYAVDLTGLRWADER